MGLAIVISLSILDGILLAAGIVLWILESKYKFKNKKATDTIWKLVEYLTMGLSGYLLGGGLT